MKGLDHLADEGVFKHYLLVSQDPPRTARRRTARPAVAKFSRRTVGAEVVVRWATGTMTTLLTGANGFIGRRLLKLGDRMLVRWVGGLENKVIGDLLEPGSLAKICVSIETVFHCTGLPDALADDAEAHRGSTSRARVIWWWRARPWQMLRVFSPV